MFNSKTKKAFLGASLILIIGLGMSLQNSESLMGNLKNLRENLQINKNNTITEGTELKDTALTSVEAANEFIEGKLTQIEEEASLSRSKKNEALSAYNVSDAKKLQDAKANIATHLETAKRLKTEFDRGVEKRSELIAQEEDNLREQTQTENLNNALDAIESQKNWQESLTEKIENYNIKRETYETAMTQTLENIEIIKINPNTNQDTQEIWTAAQVEMKSLKKDYLSSLNALKTELQEFTQSPDFETQNTEIQSWTNTMIQDLNAYETSRKALEAAGAKNTWQEMSTLRQNWTIEINSLSTQQNMWSQLRTQNLRPQTQVQNSNRWLQNSVLGANGAKAINSFQDREAKSYTSIADMNADQVQRAEKAVEEIEAINDSLKNYDVLSCTSLEFNPSELSFKTSESVKDLSLSIKLSTSTASNQNWKGHLTINGPDAVQIVYGTLAANTLDMDLAAASTISLKIQNPTLQEGTLSANLTNGDTHCSRNLALKKIVDTIFGSASTGLNTGTNNTSSSNIKTDPLETSSTTGTNSSTEAATNETPQEIKKSRDSIKKSKNLSSSSDCSEPFEDVKDEEWFKAPVCVMYNAKVIKGHSSTRFSPSDKITRAEAIKIIVNLLIDDTTPVYNSSFTDVHSNDWFASYIAIAEANDVIRTRDFGTQFHPNDPISRGDLTLYIARALNLSSYDFTLSFDDVKKSDYYAYAIAILNEKTVDLSWDDKGDVTVVEGYDENSFKPKNTINRAEALTVIYRAFMAYKSNDL